MRRSLGLLLRKLWNKYENGIYKLQMFIKGKRIEINERVNVLMAEWERKKKG